MSRPSKFLLLLSDLILAYIAYMLAFSARTEIALPLFRDTLPDYVFAILRHGWLAVGLAQVFTIYLLGLYDPPERAGTYRLAESLFLACVINTLILTSYHFFSLEFGFPRSVLIVYGVFDWVLLLSWRWILSAVSGSRRKRLAICGHGALVKELLDDIRRNPWLGYDPVGVILDKSEPGAADDPTIPILGRREHLTSLLRDHKIDEVILIPDPSWTHATVQTVKEVESTGARTLVAPSPYEMILAERISHRIRDIPLIPVSAQGSAAASEEIKRLIDVGLAIALLILTSPLVLICMILIKITSPGPSIYAQARVGRAGQTFTLYKLRTLIVSAESETGPVFVDVDDPRVTPVGRILRRLRLDELPQLVSILKNDMSFVGPRPERPDFVEQYSKAIPFYRERHRVRPGLTGLAQINGYYHTTAENKLKYDLAYVYHHTLWMDFIILFETLKVVLTRKGV